MHTLTLVVTGLACVGYGRRVHPTVSKEQTESELHAQLQNSPQVHSQVSDPSAALATVLLAFNLRPMSSESALLGVARTPVQMARSHRLGVLPLPRMGPAPHMSGDDVVEGETRALTEEEKAEVGNLVADDEWLGLGMELAIVVRSAIRESMKENVRDFTGKDEYKIGDLSKEMDARVKETVADLRGKEEYELGDLTLALDELAKEEVCKLTGKDDYEFGDLSKEVDARVKAAVNDFTGNDEYTAGDLSVEVDKRIKDRVNEFTGQGEYEFGDITKEIDKRRVAWMQDYLGKEGYEFGDLTKKWVGDFTGKDTYEFGDITKKLVSSFTGKEEYQFGDITKTIGQKLFGNKQVPKKKE